MRIIKLSTDEFETFEEMNNFFAELSTRTPIGKFRITKRRIAKDGLQIGEKLLFSYRTQVCYIAQAASGVLKNLDEYSDDYPFFFQVDVGTLHPTSISLYEVEKRLHQNGVEVKALVKTMGWPKIQDSPITEDLWRSLG